MNVSKLNYDELFIYQEKQVCETFGIMAQPYIILFVSLFIQFVIEMFLYLFDMSYKKWFFNKKLSNQKVKFCEFFCKDCKLNPVCLGLRSPEIEDGRKYNILNNQELVYDGPDKEPTSVPSINMRGIKVLIDPNNCEHIKEKMSDNYIKGVLKNSILDNALHNPKYTLNKSSTTEIFTILYMFYQTVSILIQIINILATFEFSNNNPWTNMNNLLFLILNSSSYRTFIGIICSSITFPLLDGFLDRIKIDNIKKSPLNLLDYYYDYRVMNNPNSFDTFEELKKFLIVNGEHPEFNDNELRDKYGHLYIVGRDRIYTGPNITSNGQFDNVKKVFDKHYPDYNKNVIMENIKYSDRINSIPLLKKILLISLGIIFLPFTLCGIVLFSIPMTVIYIWISILIIGFYVPCSGFFLTGSSKNTDLLKTKAFTTKISTSFCKRLFLMVFLIISFNYGVILYDGKGYGETLVIEAESRNIDVYLNCMVVDKIQNSIDFLLTYT